MPKREYLFSTTLAKNNALAKMQATPLDGKWEWVLRSAKKDKTLKQLGALFGLWVAYVVDKYGKSEKETHAEWKADHLTQIYGLDPVGPLQEQWVELLIFHQEKMTDAKLSREQRQEAADKFTRHVLRISLSWATVGQMNEYMSRIERDYQSIGDPLPVPDKFHRYRTDDAKEKS